MAARWKAPASRRHSSVWTVSRPSGLASGVFASAWLTGARLAGVSGMVRLQSQISVFIGSYFLGVGRRGGRGLAGARAAGSAAFFSSSNSPRNCDCAIWRSMPSGSGSGLP